MRKRTIVGGIPLDGFIGQLGKDTMLAVVEIVETDKRQRIQRNAAIQVRIEAALTLLSRRLGATP